MTLSERIFTKCGRPCKYDTLLHTESLSKDWSRLLVQHPHLPQVLATPVNRGGGQVHHPTGPPPPKLHPRTCQHRAAIGVRCVRDVWLLSVAPAHARSLCGAERQLLDAALELNKSAQHINRSNPMGQLASTRYTEGNYCQPNNLIENAAGPILYVKDAGNHYQSQAIWVHRSVTEASVADICANNTWVEVTHCGWFECNVSLQTPMWFLASPGSGARVNIGRSIVISGSGGRLLHLALVKGRFSTGGRNP